VNGKRRCRFFEPEQKKRSGKLSIQILRPIACNAGDFKSVLFPAKIRERCLCLFQKLRERALWWEERQCAQRLSSRLKFRVSGAEAVLAQDFEIIHQQLAVTLLQNAFECGAAEGWRQNGGIRQRIEKMEKRTEAWRALQFDPCHPFSRFENTGEHVRN